jgi:hypothetical protein
MRHLTVFFFLLAACTTRIDFDSPEARARKQKLEAKWDKDLREQKARLERVIKAEKEKCEGKFVVRYELDGWVRKHTMPIHWECITE